MAVYEALLLNTVVPQIQAAQAGDSYVMVVNATTPALRITQTGTGNALEVEDSSNPDATPFVVSAAGDVGIGTNTPSNKLTVNSGAATTTAQFTSTGSSVFLGMTNSGASAFIGADSAGSFIVQTPGSSYSTKLTVDASGNLGLGVTPSLWASGNKFMDVNDSAAYGAFGNTDAMMVANAYWNGSSWVRKTANNAFRFVMETINTSPSISWGVAANGAQGSTFTFTQAMTLDASGNLGVGTTSPDIFGRFHGRIVGIAATSGNAFIEVAGASGASGGLEFGAGTTRHGTLSGSATEVQLATNTNIPLLFATNGPERARITSGGNLNFGNSSADRATTAGTAVINIFNGTAPVGTLANGISLYSSSGEAYVMDAAGNATLFSPHDSETNEWIFKSKHTPSGKVLKIDVEKMLRFINDHFGLDAIHEFTEE
jgi:hypothetical protein